MVEEIIVKFGIRINLYSVQNQLWLDRLLLQEIFLQFPRTNWVGRSHTGVYGSTLVLLVIYAETQDMVLFKYELSK